MKILFGSLYVTAMRPEFKVYTTGTNFQETSYERRKREYIRISEWLTKYRYCSDYEVDRIYSKMLRGEAVIQYNDSGRPTSSYSFIVMDIGYGNSKDYDLLRNRASSETPGRIPFFNGKKMGEILSSNTERLRDWWNEKLKI